VLLTAGYRDPRVRYWEPAKFAARLRHALRRGGSSDSSTDGDSVNDSANDSGDNKRRARTTRKGHRGVVLLETNMGAGHAGDAQDDARDLAFLIHEVGER
jgi:protease II